MDSYSVLVTTCDKYLWIMRLFCQLFNNHWGTGEIVSVLCESLPTFDYPSNFRFYSVNGGTWPKDEWAVAVREFLPTLGTPNIVLLLDDYLLARDVDVNGVEALSEYMVRNKDILRIDLTGDRLWARGDARNVDEVGSCKHLDLIACPGTSYEMSLQSGLFNTHLLSLILRDGLSPWTVELQSQGTIDHHHMRILGTRQMPVKYVNALGTGTPPNSVKLLGIDPMIIERAMYYKWIPEDYTVMRGE